MRHFRGFCAAVLGSGKDTGEGKGKGKGDTTSSLTTHRATMAVVFAATAAVLHRGCLDHPFLLADNRHYTFYTWRWALRHSALRLALTPVVVYGAWLAHTRLGTRTGWAPGA